MKIDTDDGPDVDDFVVVEDGTYPIRIAEAREMRSGGGDASWMLRLELVEGPLAGRTAVTDWLNFGVRGLHRVRRVLDALGFDLSKPVEVEAHELVGREALVTLETRESVSADHGRVQRRSRVIYDGWAPLSRDRVGDGDTRAGGGGGGGGSTVAADTMPF